MLDRRTILLGAGSAAMFATTRAFGQARSHLVEMQGAPGGEMAFAPRILRVASGDSVTFSPVGPVHNCQSTPGMVPQGASSWRGSIGKAVTVTFGVPGYYGYHCLPHRSLGMVGLVIVEGEGRDANFQAAQAVRHPGKAAAVWDAIWREAGL